MGFFALSIVFEGIFEFAIQFFQSVFLFFSETLLNIQCRFSRKHAFGLRRLLLIDTDIFIFIYKQVKL